MRDLHQRIARLSPEKQRLLKAQLAERGVSLGDEPLIPRRQSCDASGPLSFTQQRLWFIHQLEPDSPAYNMPKVFRISGPLNAAIVQQALEAVVARHETLRTTFITIEGNPVQVIAQNWSLELPVIDVSNLSPEEREGETQQLLVKETQRPFDLSQDLMIRSALYRLGDEEFILLLVTHHIASDHWSTGILIRELAALYEAFSTGTASPLPQLPIQYADFAAWQRVWHQGEEMARQLSYWRERLGSGLPTLTLPIDRPRPAIQSYHGARQSFALPKALSEALNHLSRREGATLFMTLLAAFKTLLYRYTGQDDIIVGSPIAGRNRVEIEGLIGSFINTLVLRTDLSETPSFLEVLKRTRQVVLEAYAHQEVPFEKLVDELQPKRDLSHTPVFQILFDFLNDPEPVERIFDLMVDRLEIDKGSAIFDLTFYIRERAGELAGAVEYNTDLFDAATISRMIGHFKVLLNGIVSNPEMPISEMPLLTDTEQKQLLVEWNSTHSDYPQDQCIHQLFEAQAEQNPDAVAIVFNGEAMTYRQLNYRANQLARNLRHRGVGPDTSVGLCMERSLEMMIAVLGILKAGGAYVPLDPAYPQQRLALIIEDTRMPLLLTQESLLKALPKHRAGVICLDTGWGNIAQESTENLTSNSTPDNLAYVLYTSGSTGRPKGVAMPHRPLCNLIAWQLQNTSHSYGTRTLQFASLNFDVSFQEMFSAWCSGETLVLISDELRRDTISLVDFLKNEKVERLFLPFVALQQLAEVAVSRGVYLAHLREIITAGEQLQITEPVRNFLGVLEGCTLHNHYGPTESHVVTAFTMQKAPLDWPALPPIGRPITNAEIYLLDVHQQPVPVGVQGELHIGGVCLARGYFNRPELTHERFIENPFSDKPGARLYKTGDIARYLPDGNIEFLGRMDHQVKIRGFRIEPGEVEALLRQHPSVNKAVVIAREDIPGDRRLVAYIVPKQRQTPSIEKLRDDLKQKLPDYMIPSALVILDALPLTPSGKVNPRALPAPNQTMSAEVFIAPRNELEYQLAAIWGKVLGVSPIGIQDNFFDLGGHSVLAVRLFAQIGKVFRKDMPLVTLFQAPTIEQLANILRDRGWKPSWSSLVPIQPQGSKPPLFCAHAVGGNVLSLRDLGRHLGLDQPFYALQSQGLDGKQVVPSRVEEMAAYYIEEIRTIQPEGPYFLAGQSSGGTIAYEMAQQLHRQGHQVALLALIDSPVIERRRILPKAASLRYRLSFHAKNLFRLGPNYILVRVKDRSKRVRVKVEGKIVRSTTNFYVRLGRPLPHALRYANVREMIRQAMKSYVPQVYPGRVVLFRATDTFQAYVRSYEDLRQAWSEMAAGGIEILNVPGEHNLEKEPYVGVLAERLKTCLEEGGNNSSKNGS